LEVSGHLHASAALPPGKELLYPLDRRLGRPQNRLDDMQKRKLMPLRGLDCIKSERKIGKAVESK
jgi:hypothetical protein